jgi:hypothetical protein
MGQPTRDQHSILDDLFPSAEQMTVLFAARRAMTTNNAPLPQVAGPDDLTPAEIEFIQKCERRREHLRTIGDGDKQVAELKDMYSWESFLRELRAYIAKSWEMIVGSRGGKPRRPAKKRTIVPTAPVSASNNSTDMSNLIPSAQQQVPHSTHPQGVPTDLPAASGSNQPIWEAYEKARLTNMPHIGPAGSTLGTSTGIPPPEISVVKPTQRSTTIEPSGQVRRPWTKDEGDFF